MIYLSDIKKLSFSNGRRVLTTSKTQNATWDMLQDYDEHKEKCANGKVLLNGYDAGTGVPQEKEIPILYRTDGRYKKRLIAKLYTLEPWYENLPRTMQLVSMLTFTTKQIGLSFFEQYSLLRDSWKNVRDLIKHQHPHAEYIVIWEPHKSGYAHIHVVYFGVKFTPDYSDKLKQLWMEKYGAGGADAIKIDTRYTGTLKSACNYIMKYVSKTLTDDGCQSINTYDDSDLKKHVVDEGVHFKIFNAVLWQMSKHDTDFKGIRSFQPSRTLSKVMSNKLEKSNIIWNEVWFCYGNERFLIHKDDTVNPRSIRRAHAMLTMFRMDATLRSWDGVGGGCQA